MRTVRSSEAAAEDGYSLMRANIRRSWDILTSFRRSWQVPPPEKHSLILSFQSPPQLLLSSGPTPLPLSSLGVRLFSPVSSSSLYEQTKKKKKQGAIEKKVSCE